VEGAGGLKYDDVPSFLTTSDVTLTAEVSPLLFTQPEALSIIMDRLFAAIQFREEEDQQAAASGSERDEVVAVLALISLLSQAIATVTLAQTLHSLVEFILDDRC